jgi:hypothetical protein
MPQNNVKRGCKKSPNRKGQKRQGILIKSFCKTNSNEEKHRKSDVFLFYKSPLLLPNQATRRASKGMIIATISCLEIIR